MMPTYDDWQKPSRIKRRRKRGWRNKMGGTR
jgi:hypothetical protein